MFVSWQFLDIFVQFEKLSRVRINIILKIRNEYYLFKMKITDLNDVKTNLIEMKYFIYHHEKNRNINDYIIII